MHIDWSGDKCILCLSKASLTNEHVIPSSLGGALTCRFLCCACNSRLGASIESLAKTDPSIRLAVEQLRPAIPELANQFMEGQRFVSHGPGGTERGTVKGGQFRIRGRKAEDGSLISAMQDGPNLIENVLRKSDEHESVIKEALRQFPDAPENEKISIAPRLNMTKWTIERIAFDFSKSVLLSPLVPLKIAYEFLACHLVTAVYDDTQQMEEIRTVLNNGTESHPCYSVERMHASEYKPFHGIVFEDNDPYAKVQVRLFGWLAFRVHFKHLAVAGPRFVYTHLLDSNDENVSIAAHPMGCPTAG